MAILCTSPEVGGISPHNILNVVVFLNYITKNERLPSSINTQ